MKVLAIDCSAKAVSAAIAEDGKLISEGFLNINLTHSQTLLPLCEQVLNNAKLTLSDIDAFAVTKGPGSFTGIRIGISAIKGLAFDENKPVFAASTLLAMALCYFESPPLNAIICALMDARRNQFYNALFKVQKGQIIRLTDDRAVSKEALETELKKVYNDSNVICIGDGASLFYEQLKNEDNIYLASHHNIIQRASHLAIAASLNALFLEKLSPEGLQPTYLRPSQAERERAEKLGN